MHRRTFIATSGQAIVGSVLALGLLPFLEGCSSVPLIEPEVLDGVARVPRSAFVVNGELIQVVTMHAPGSNYLVALVNNPPSEAIALYMRCTHKSCPLSVDYSSFSCSCHGSEFDFLGNVLQGPAKEALLTLPVTSDDFAFFVDCKKLR